MAFAGQIHYRRGDEISFDEQMPLRVGRFKRNISEAQFFYQAVQGKAEVIGNSFNIMVLTGFVCGHELLFNKQQVGVFYCADLREGTSGA